jgi:glycerol-3-phosphate dehydrogenase
MPVRKPFSAATHHIAVVGAGVVGCAVFRELVLAGLSAVLLERDADIINGASKANSAILHTGFDAPPSSLEHACIRAGHRAYHEIHGRLNLPLIESGAVMVAWNRAEADRLPGIVAQAHANGVPDVRLLTPAETLELEPGLAPDLTGGLLVPGESLIDPWSAPLAYALQGQANGGTILRNAEVSAGRFENGWWMLTTAKGPVSARVVINCAGNYGDLVEAMARPSPFAIRPRKGQFVVFDKSAHRLTSSIVLPTPNERTKGVVVTPTCFGNLLVGPTAEDQDERRIASVEQSVLKELIARGRRILPRLADHPVTAVFAGLRPATQFKDYQIEALAGRNWITVGGIRSTGLSAALGIAQHVRGLYEANFGPLAPLRDVVWTPVPALAETATRPYALPGRSEIVCHCELVTRSEIEAALSGPLPAIDLGGLRRRTRCMMGYCQGFYCSRRVLELVGDRIPGLAESLPRDSSA